MRTKTTFDRFRAKYVVAPSGCWEWTGAKTKAGYGIMLLKERSFTTAHRIGYELLVGPIPAGLEIDHLCRNKQCVNPTHLEPVTHQENERRKVRLPQTSFRCGHPFVAENWYTLTNGSRYCKHCQLVRCRRRNRA